MRVRVLLPLALIAVASLAPAPSFAAPTSAGSAARPESRTPAGVAAVAPQCGVHPWCDASMSPDARAALVVGAMTTDEKVMFLGGNTSPTTGHTGQSYAIARLDIPAVSYTDGPVGPRQGSATAMPIPMAVAATFDPATVTVEGTEIATEARAKGNDAVFGPTVNIMRTPMGGRTYEAYGEDTYLDAHTTVPWIRGAQSTGVMAVVKHLAANNQEGAVGAAPLTGAEGGRLVVDAVVDQRTLHEVYYPHFEAAVQQADVATVMCSYNMLNGTYACENDALLHGVLESEFGFKGDVVSDYGAAHNPAANLNSGLDTEISGPQDELLSYNPAEIDAVLGAGLVSQATIDSHVQRILRTWFAFGVFDRPAYVDDDGQIDKAADDAKAEQVEEQAITLLQNNDHILPLTAATKKIAVIGPAADSFVTGGGSGGVTPYSTVLPLAGITTRAGAGTTVTYDDGSDATTAAADAKAADVAVVVVNDVESEGQDKSCIDLNCTSDLENQVTACGQSSTRPCPSATVNQDALIASVAAANPNTIVVTETGGPVLTPWRTQVKAVVSAWYGGQEIGTALARVLFGDVDPGGRSPDTWPVSAADEEVAGSTDSYPGNAAEQETYTEGVLVGYKWFDAHHEDVAYPFGGGLSYTTFSYSDVVATASGVTARVTNTGDRTGTAVPQLYVDLPAPSADVVQPPRTLRGYQKISLAPGTSRTVTFPLTARDLQYYDATTASWLTAPGCYVMEVGADDRDLPVHATVPVGGATCDAAAPGDPVVVPVQAPGAPEAAAGEQATLASTGIPAGLVAVAAGVLLVGLVLRRWSSHRPAGR